jgi:hypothetical protein
MQANGQNSKRWFINTGRDALITRELAGLLPPLDELQTLSAGRRWWDSVFAGVHRRCLNPGKLHARAAAAPQVAAIRRPAM